MVIRSDKHDVGVFTPREIFAGVKTPAKVMASKTPVTKNNHELIFAQKRWDM